MSDDDELTEAAAAYHSLRIKALLEATAGTPEQGLLIYRIRTTLNELGKDFPPDRVALEKHRAEIERARDEYYAILLENSERALKWLWGEDEIGQRKIAEMREELARHRATYNFDAWAESVINGTE